MNASYKKIPENYRNKTQRILITHKKTKSMYICTPRKFMYADRRPRLERSLRFQLQQFFFRYNFKSRLVRF